METHASRPPSASRRVATLLPLIAAVVAVVWGGVSYDAWTSDDAFISFRCARNLVEGRGLVFNAGERVEVFTNFLWTLWAALGLALGATAERWSQVWGAGFYFASILLLAWNHRRCRRAAGWPAWSVPLAALGAAAHRDWGVFAGSGLETAAFTFLLLAGFLIVVSDEAACGRLVWAGVVFGLATLTRPEGVLPATVVVGYLLIVGRPRWKTMLAFWLPFAAIVLLFLGWRLAYYGDWLPNTYYAKSADRAWYAQGWHYLTLYFERYWALLAAPLLWAIAALTGRLRGLPSPLGRQAWLAAAIAGAYTFYVARVGGDFMFARFLIPATPFYLLALEQGWAVAAPRRALPALSAAALLLAGIAFTPAPVSGTRARHGVIDEHAYYSPQRVATLERKAALLRRIFAGVPVRVAFYGDEARLVYRAEFPVAIESHAGLTEPAVARQELTRRGRVGHEKHPSAIYLIEERGAQITFSGVPQRLLQLQRYIPEIIVELGDGFTGQLLRWDPELVAAMRERGVRVPPFLDLLDGYLAQLERLPDSRVAEDYERFRRFYFDHVDDPPRQAPFERRLAGR